MAGTSDERRLLCLSYSSGEGINQERGQIKIVIRQLVFANYDGKPIDPVVLSHNFARIVRQAGLERVRFHDLRHTFASLALLRGAKPKVLSVRLSAMPR